MTHSSHSSPTKFVRPLEDAWQNVIDATLRERGAPITSDVERLAPKVAVLSRAYNAGLGPVPEFDSTSADSAANVIGGGLLRCSSSTYFRTSPPRASNPAQNALSPPRSGIQGQALAGDRGEVRAPTLPLEARVGFSFARDVPKGSAAVRELVAKGALAIPEARPLRIVDVGAGLGAMTWGVVRALEAANQSGSVNALLVDEDRAVLTVARTIADKAASRFSTAPVKLTVETRTESIRPGLRLPQADLLVMGQVLSELDLALAPQDRVARHAAILSEWLASSVSERGALVVIEPALRNRTRHLHAVRDALIMEGKAQVLAPCLHALVCPAYAIAGEWCHDDLDVDLPAWLVPLARAAGLRWQGLTFSYLVLRAPEAHARAGKPEAHARRLRLRVISDVMRTKGKIEMFGCTEAGDRIRLRRLDRDANACNAVMSELHRGDIVTLTADSQGLVEGGRIAPNVTVEIES
ncbi:MAG: small ribosomal subunit Rsm22 family protein [Polyangiaceae bacterium]|nr:small ribosomal subunit Rsm22 family protein [Polyangiaceae bacterium]